MRHSGLAMVEYLMSKESRKNASTYRKEIRDDGKIIIYTNGDIPLFEIDPIDKTFIRLKNAKRKSWDEWFLDNGYTGYDVLSKTQKDLLKIIRKYIDETLDAKIFSTDFELPALKHTKGNTLYVDTNTIVISLLDRDEEYDIRYNKHTGHISTYRQVMAYYKASFIKVKERFL